MCITQPLLSLKLGKMCTEYSPVLGHSYLGTPALGPHLSPIVAQRSLNSKNY